MISSPAYPDPKVTASAQADMNRDTALTQQLTNMTNQSTPDGSLTYTQNGTNSFVGTDGKTVTVPQFTATTKLSDAQQGIKNQTDASKMNIASLANNQSAFLKDYLGSGMDTSSAPALKSDIGGGYSGDVGGSYSDQVGGNYTTSLGGNYTTDLGNDWKTSYAGADDFGAQRKMVTDAIKARAAPDQQAQQRDLETQLIGRGLRPGTAAWDSEQARLGKQMNDFSLAADLAGGQEQSRLVGLSRDAAMFGNDATMQRAQFGNNSELAKAQFGNSAELSRFGAQNNAAMQAASLRNDAALKQASFQNAARGQSLQELYASRNQPINEISSLLSGSQVSNPTFGATPTASVGGVDYTGLVDSKYKADLQAQQAQMGGLFGLLSGGISLLSDRRAKTDIKRVGTLDNGLPVYSYRYKGEIGTQIGLMADEVEQLHPRAVSTGDDGFKRVRYDLAVEAA